jgi:hypothetical protein
MSHVGPDEPRATDRIAATAPPGADLTSWRYH